LVIDTYASTDNTLFPLFHLHFFKKGLGQPKKKDLIFIMNYFVVFYTQIVRRHYARICVEQELELSL